jgi:predicted nucleic acid-binding protein
MLTTASFLNPLEEDYLQAAHRVRTYHDQPLTLVDAVLTVLSERLGLPVWSYDYHFDLLRVPRWL